MLAGSILMNCDNGRCILVNTVRVYVREKPVELPPILIAIPTYTNVWPCNTPVKGGTHFINYWNENLRFSVIQLDRREE